VLSSLKTLVNTATCPGPHHCSEKGHAITAELMCFNIWAQQAVSTAPASSNLRRESSFSDPKVQKLIQDLIAEVQTLKANQAQFMGLVHMHRAEMEARAAADRQAGQAEREQDMDLVGMQIAEADAKIDALSRVVDAKLAADRQTRQAEREQDASMLDMQIAGMEANLQAQVAQELQARQQDAAEVPTKLQAERLETQNAVDSVQTQWVQDKQMVDMQFEQVETRARSGFSRAHAQRSGAEAKVVQSTEAEAKLEVDRLDTDAV